MADIQGVRITVLEYDLEVDANLDDVKVGKLFYRVLGKRIFDLEWVYV